MRETEFFNDGNVTVSWSRFIVDGQTYAMNGVTSVRTAQQKPGLVGSVLIGLLSLLFLTEDAVAMKVVGLAMVFGAFVLWAKRKPKYTVVLSSASGEAKALSSTDGTFIQAVVKALNDCIVARG